MAETSTTPFKTIKQFAVDYNVSYQKMIRLVKKILPGRKPGMLRPAEVRKMTEHLENLL